MLFRSFGHTLRVATLAAALLGCLALGALAQTGIGTTTPSAQAILDLRATDRGLLVPRLTTAQRTALGTTLTPLNNPLNEGMIVYDTDLDQHFAWNETTNAWQSLAGSALPALADGTVPRYNGGTLVVGSLFDNGSGASSTFGGASPAFTGRNTANAASISAQKTSGTGVALEVINNVGGEAILVQTGTVNLAPFNSAGAKVVYTPANSGVLDAVTPGLDGQVLKLVGGVPTWDTDATGIPAAQSANSAVFYDASGNAVFGRSNLLNNGNNVAVGGVAINPFADLLVDGASPTALAVGADNPIHPTNIAVSGTASAATTLNIGGAFSATSAPGTTARGVSVNVTGTGTSYAGTFMGGKVGVGTLMPTALLDLNQTSTTEAALRLRTQTTSPSLPNEGDIYADGNTVFYRTNASTWLDLGAIGGFTPPAANVVPRSDGANLVAGSITDNGTEVTVASATGGTLFTLSNSGTGAAGYFGNTSASPTLQVENSGTGAALDVVSGGVNIQDFAGTNPSLVFATAGGTLFAQAGTAAGNVAYFDGTDWQLSAAPGPNEVLKWNGTAWAPAPDATGGTPTGTNNAVAFYDGTGALNAGFANFNYNSVNQSLVVSNATTSPTLQANKVIGGSGAALEVENLSGIAADPAISVNTNTANAIFVNAGDISLSGTTSELVYRVGPNVTGFRAPGGLLGDQVYTLPSDAPAAGEVLTTDAAGNLSWAPDATGGTPTGTNNAVAFYDGVGALNPGNANFTYSLLGQSLGLVSTTTQPALQVSKSGSGAALQVENTSGSLIDPAILVNTNTPVAIQVALGDVSLAPSSELVYRVGPNVTGFRAPGTVPGNQVYTLPADAPAAGEVLTTDAAGVLSWAPPALPTGTPNALAFYEPGGNLSENINATYDGTTINAIGGGIGAPTLRLSQTEAITEPSLEILESELRFVDLPGNGGEYFALRPSNFSANQSYILPPDPAGVGEVLKVTAVAGGNYTLDWAPDATGGTPTGTNNAVAFYDAGGALNPGTANFTYDGATLLSIGGTAPAAEFSNISAGVNTVEINNSSGTGPALNVTSGTVTINNLSASVAAGGAVVTTDDAGLLIPLEGTVLDQVLKWNGTAWVAGVDATGGTPTGTADRVAFYDGLGALNTGSSNLTFDGNTLAASSGSTSAPGALISAAGGSLANPALEVFGGELRIVDGEGEYFAFRPADFNANRTYTLPNDIPANGDVLTTDAAGVLSWAPPALPTGGNNTVAYFDAGGNFSSNAQLAYDGTVFSVSNPGTGGAFTAENGDAGVATAVIFNNSGAVSLDIPTGGVQVAGLAASNAVSGFALVGADGTGLFDAIEGTAADQVLKWNVGTGAWELGTDNTGGVPAGTPDAVLVYDGAGTGVTSFAGFTLSPSDEQLILSTNSPNNAFTATTLGAGTALVAVAQGTGIAGQFTAVGAVPTVQITNFGSGPGLRITGGDIVSDPLAATTSVTGNTILTTDDAGRFVPLEGTAADQVLKWNVLTGAWELGTDNVGAGGLPLGQPANSAVFYDATGNAAVGRNNLTNNGTNITVTGAGAGTLALLVGQTGVGSEAVQISNDPGQRALNVTGGDVDFAATTQFTLGAFTGASSQVLYTDAGGQVNGLAAGSDGTVLTLAGGVPSWASVPAPTGTANTLPFFNGTGVLTSDANLQYLNGDLALGGIAPDADIDFLIDGQDPTSLALRSNETSANNRALEARALNGTASSVAIDVDVSGSPLNVGVEVDAVGALGQTTRGLDVEVTGGGTLYAATFTGGNVGVGTTTPAEQLEVAGRILIQDGPAPGTTTNRLYANAGNLFWNGVDISTAGSTLVGYTNAAPTATALGVGAGVVNTGNDNTFVGNGAGNANSTGTRNVFIGHNAGVANTIALNNVFVGQNAGSANVSGNENTFLGFRSGFANTASNNTFLGARAGDVNTTGGDNVFVGLSAGGTNTLGASNTFVGASAGGAVVDGSNNLFAGRGAGQSFNGNSSSNVVLGQGADRSGGAGITDNVVLVGAGSRSRGNGVVAVGAFAQGESADAIAIGRASIVNTTAVGSIAIGVNSSVDVNATGSVAVGAGAAANAANAVAIGAGVTATQANTIILGDGAPAYNVGMGTATPAEQLEVAGRILIQDGPAPGTTTNRLYANAGNLFWNGVDISTAGSTLVGYTSAAPTATALGVDAGVANTGVNNTFVGNSAGQGNAGAGGNTFVGATAGTINTTGQRNTFLGTGAGFNNNADDNTFVGNGAGFENTTGINNVFVGRNAGNANQATSNNTFLGAFAGVVNTAAGNTFVGARAGDANTTGTNNVFVGLNAGGANTTGSLNTFVGDNAGLLSTASFNTFIGASTGAATTTGASNTFVGDRAGNANVVGTNNAYLGASAGIQSTASNNTLLGALAGGNLATGANNTFVGASAGLLLNGVSERNTIVGNGNSTAAGALTGVTLVGDGITIGTLSDLATALGTGASVGGNASNSVAIGLASIGNSAAGSIAIGNAAVVADNFTNAVAIGSNTAIGGNSSIAIGDQASTDAANAVAIGTQVTATQANTIILGDGAPAYNVGMGTATPNERLEVAGRILIQDDALPGTTTNRLYANAGNLFWNGTNISAGGAGANVTLSNLGATAINTDLVFADGANRLVRIADAPGGLGNSLTLRSGRGAAASGNGSLNLEGADLNGAGFAGSVNIVGGTNIGSGAPGNVRLVGGAGSTTPGNVLLAWDGAAARGNVGIGTGTPTALLDLNQTSTTTAALRLRTQATAPSVPNPGDIYADNSTVYYRTLAGTWLDLGASSAGANLALSNLGATAINADLLPDADGTRSLGTGPGNDWLDLYLTGGVYLDGSYFAGNEGTNNTFLGIGTGFATTGTDNVFLGTNAGSGAGATGSDNVFVGVNAGDANTSGAANTFLGRNAGAVNNSGQNNVMIGASSGLSSTTGLDNVFIGNNAGQAAGTGSSFNTYVGRSAGVTVAGGDGNTFLGNNAGANVNGNTQNSIYIGNASGRSVAGPSTRATALGFASVVNGADAMALGANAQATNTNSVAIGPGVTAGQINTIILGDGAPAYDVGIGTATPNAAAVLDVSSTTKGFLPPRMTTLQRDAINGGVFAEGLVIYNTDDDQLQYYDPDNFGDWVGVSPPVAGANLTLSNLAGPTSVNADLVPDADGTRDIGAAGLGADWRDLYLDGSLYIADQRFLAATGLGNILVGGSTGDNLSTGDANVFVGSNAGNEITTGNDNVFVGSGAGSGSSGASASQNVAIGSNSGGSLGSGNDNTFLGHFAGRNVQNNSSNTFIGAFAGDQTESGANTFVGFSAGRLNNTTVHNTYLGVDAGRNLVSGSRNVFVGHSAGNNITTNNSDDNVVIGNLAGRSGAGILSDAVIIGSNTTVDQDAGIAIGSGSSVNALVGVVLGTSSTVAPGAINAVAIGNQVQATQATTIVLGDGDGVGPDYNVGIGTPAPSERLEVAGRILIQDDVLPGTTTNRLYANAGNLFWNGTNISAGGSGWSLTGNGLLAIGNLGSNTDFDVNFVRDGNPLARMTTDGIDSDHFVIGVPTIPGGYNVPGNVGLVLTTDVGFTPFVGFSREIVVGPSPDPGDSGTRLLIAAGDGNGGIPAVVGGDLDLRSGSGGTAGNINIEAAASAQSPGGQINLTAGGSALDVGGDVNIAAGTANAGGGNVTLVGGSASAGPAGAVFVTGGNGGSAPGDIVLQPGTAAGVFGKVGIAAGTLDSAATLIVRGTQVRTTFTPGVDDIDNIPAAILAENTTAGNAINFGLQAVAKGGSFASIGAYHMATHNQGFLLGSITRVTPTGTAEGTAIDANVLNYSASGSIKGMDLSARNFGGTSNLIQGANISALDFNNSAEDVVGLSIQSEGGDPGAPVFISGTRVNATYTGAGTPVAGSRLVGLELNVSQGLLPSSDAYSVYATNGKAYFQDGVQLGAVTFAPGATEQGLLRYNAGAFEGWNGVTWLTLSGGASLEGFTGSYTALGVNAGASGPAGFGNVGVGNAAMNALVTGDRNTFVGTSAGQGANNVTNNTAVGFNAGASLTLGGNDNIMIGSTAGDGVSSGTANVLIGTDVAPFLSTGSGNVVIGGVAGGGNLDTGADNVFIGNGAATVGNTTTGSIALGANTRADADFAVAIGTGTTASQANSIILGDGVVNYDIGIGLPAPAAKLHVSGGANPTRLQLTNNTFGNAATDGVFFEFGAGGVNDFVIRNQEVGLADVSIFAGPSSGTAPGGQVSLSGGSSANGQAAGVAVVQGGENTNTGAGGSASLLGGDGGSAGGNAIVSGGDGTVPGNVLLAPSEGNVGIGTNNAYQDLVVYRSDNNTTGLQGAFIDVVNQNPDPNTAAGIRFQVSDQTLGTDTRAGIFAVRNSAGRVNVKFANNTTTPPDNVNYLDDFSVHAQLIAEKDFAFTPSPATGPGNPGFFVRRETTFFLGTDLDLALNTQLQVHQNFILPPGSVDREVTLPTAGVPNIGLKYYFINATAGSGLNISTPPGVFINGGGIVTVPPGRCAMVLVTSPNNWSAFIMEPF